MELDAPQRTDIGMNLARNLVDIAQAASSDPYERQDILATAIAYLTGARRSQVDSIPAEHWARGIANRIAAEELARLDAQSAADLNH